MKKLFLLLILSLFSTQSFAGSCPDGSDPVKSISADGTYFVYNCGGGNEQSSSSTNTGSWNDPGPLDELTIPDNWQLFKNNQIAFMKTLWGDYDLSWIDIYTLPHTSNGIWTLVQVEI